jgi:UDP-N-acetylmuramate dehydrogenase
MRRHTTFGIGGPADAYAMVADVDEMTLLVQGANQRSLPWRVVGKGSNLLVRDGGIRGIVINPAPHMCAVTVIDDATVGEIAVTAQAGLSLPALCRLALANGWAGMNFALGIPGCVGGAISMNAGSAEGCVADVLQAVTLLDRQAKRITVAADKITWAYRQAGWPRDSIIVEGTVKLQAVDKQQLKREARQWVVARKRRQPAEPSAGCFFKNPSPHYPAGRLIDQAGLKGQRIGKAAVSKRHANFIVNLGGASAGEVLALVRLIQTTVTDRFGIVLEPEVVILGEEGHAQESL